MGPQVTLDVALTALANLLNQNSTPNAERTRRTFFIVSAVERLYRSFDWLGAQLDEALTTDADGHADIADLAFGTIPGFSYVGLGDITGAYTGVAIDDLATYSQGDRKYAIFMNEDGEWELHTTEPNAELVVRYWSAPTISNEQPVVFTAMVIGKGALIYYRQAQDPEADVGPEEDEFRQEVEEIMEAQERRRPQRFASSPHDRRGYGIGDNS